MATLITPAHLGASTTALLDLIGHTPLLPLACLGVDLPPEVSVRAKAEWFNPGGSVKDRAALRMVLDGERTGALRPGKTILDATSGNTGIALAMIGAARGYPVRLCLPANASRERQAILRAYGADLVLTDPMDLTDGAQREARRLNDSDPRRYFYADQYNNPANWKAHYYGTAIEIWQQTEGGITHFVAGLGTSGTFIGTGLRLRELNPGVRLISFYPDSPYHALDGLKHMPTALVPGIYDPSLADRTLEVSTEDAQAMMRRLAREEALLVGPSGAAAAVAALRVARGLREGLVVTVFPDSACRYLSEPWFEGVWDGPEEK